MGHGFPPGGWKANGGPVAGTAGPAPDDVQCSSATDKSKLGVLYLLSSRLDPGPNYDEA